MKRDFTHENFEHFLKQSADNLRMKAPDKVWQNLSKQLGKRRRRFAIGLSTFLLITSTVGYYTISNISQADMTSQELNSQSTTNAKTDSKETNQETTTPSAAHQPTALTQPQPNQSIDKEPLAKKQVLAPVFNLNGELVLPAETNLVANEQFPPLNFTPTIVDSYTEFDQPETTSQPKRQADGNVSNALPLTIESVINSYKAKNKKNRIEKQFYFAPTISYRKLAENKSYLRSLDPAVMPTNYPALYSSVNNNVTHKPDIGFEIGLTAKYPVSNKLKIRSGLQFNVNRYDVKAFSSPLSIATIALNTGAGVDSLQTISGYSNERRFGYKSNWLQNFSLQVSVPVGVEYTLSSTDKMQFGIASTIQPTYVLGDRAYLITTDYKSYTQVPWLIRRWNVNTALETFVSYKSGKTQWQIGPQVRYQLLSSFISKYPVKENLFDFGVKVGVTLNR